MSTTYIANLFEISEREDGFHFRVTPSCHVHPDITHATVMKDDSTVASVPIPIPILDCVALKSGTYLILTGRTDGRNLSPDEKAGRVISEPVIATRKEVVASIPILEAVDKKGVWTISYGAEDSDEDVDFELIARGSALLAGTCPESDSDYESEEEEDAWLAGDYVHVANARVFMAQFLKTQEVDMGALSLESILLVGLMAEMEPNASCVLAAATEKLQQVDEIATIMDLRCLMDRWHLSSPSKSTHIRSVLEDAFESQFDVV